MVKRLRSYAIIALGSVLFALAFDMFYIPNDIALGGATGLAQVINALLPLLPVGLCSILLNVPLFLLGWKYLGFRMLATSLFSMAVSSIAIDAIHALHQFPPMDPILACLCGGPLLGLGLGIVFTQGATTGGTDVVARLLKLKFPWLPMGQLVLIPDIVVLALAAITFHQLETALYGAVSLVVTTKVMDTVLYGMDTSKVAYIISDRWREVADALLNEQERGVTILNGEGAYTGDSKRVLLVAFKQKEIAGVRQAVHEIDEHAFFIVCNANEVLGEGFGVYCQEAL